MLLRPIIGSRPLLDDLGEKRGKGEKDIEIRPRRRPLAVVEQRRQTLTKRETECLGWAARGKTAYETGIVLGISVETIRIHLKNAASKLDASNRTHAVALAICGRMIEVEL